MIDSGSAKISADGQELLKTLAEELGKLPNTLAMEGRTDSKPYAACSRTAFARTSLTQVRGFADQRLRKKDNPLDPANRRISLIVQYLITPEPASGGTGKDGEKAGEKAGEKSAEKSAEKHTK